MSIFNQLAKGKSDLLLVAVVMAILMILFVPIPAFVLDLLLILNFTVAMLVLLLTFYTDKPLSFSTFPSLLLITTLFRLGLNISATRLILDHGNAGQVISTVGEHVVGGNYVIGLVVFFILIIVQYVVVTNGAQRVAEVAARFTLDSLPGKQMSIDADLNMGLIDADAAKARRKELERETNFYGAMDGASKFVKGDAIAGIIIILIDIIGGLSIGLVQLGLSWADALHNYTLLTVGDGIVTQIPALVIATATGIIITRATSDAQLGSELGKQFTSQPMVLFVVATVLSTFLFMPNIPKTPIVFIALLLFAVGFYALKYQAATQEQQEESEQEQQVSQAFEQTNIDAHLVINPLELRCSESLLVELQNSTVFLEQLNTFRSNYAKDYGFILPKLILKADKKLPKHHYNICIYDALIAKGSVMIGKLLAIDPSGKLYAVDGETTQEPTFGLPAAWIDETQKSAAKQAKYTVVDAETALLTHVTETIKSHAYDLLTRKEAELIIQRYSQVNAGLIDELIPSILTYSNIQRVLQQLLKENVSIKAIELILETLADKATQNKDITFLVEQVRTRLKNQICQPLINEHNELHVITLAPELEQQITQDIAASDSEANISISPILLDSIIKQLTSLVDSLLRQRKPATLLCTPLLRSALKRMLERINPQLHVLSTNEIPSRITVKMAGTIKQMREVA